LRLHERSLKNVRKHSSDMLQTCHGGKSRTEMPDTTDQKQDTRFKPGQSGNPAGRPKGSRNKVREKLLEALAIDFDDHGKEVIEKVRSERPADYLKIVASLVPKRWRSMICGRAKEPRICRITNSPQSPPSA
jgi:Family of unknown function (DUF5681)